MTVEQLIAEQRQRMNSGDPVERFIAALLLSGMLAERLNYLSDPLVGRLLLDKVWSGLSLFTPESTICLTRSIGFVVPQMANLPNIRRTQANEASRFVLPR